MLLYNSEYFSVNYLEIQYLTAINFYVPAKALSHADLINKFIEMHDKMVKRKSRHFFINVKNIEHLMTNEFVKWFNDFHIPLIASTKADRIAWVNAQNLSLNIEIEKMESYLEQKIFTETEQAMKWLLEAPERKPFSFENGNKPKHHNHSDNPEN